MVAKTISFFDQFICIDRDGMIAKKEINYAMEKTQSLLS